MREIEAQRQAKLREYWERRKEFGDWWPAPKQNDAVEAPATIPPVPPCDPVAPIDAAAKPDAPAMEVDAAPEPALPPAGPEPEPVAAKPPQQPRLPRKLQAAAAAAGG